MLAGGLLMFGILATKDIEVSVKVKDKDEATVENVVKEEKDEKPAKSAAPKAKKAEQPTKAAAAPSKKQETKTVEESGARKELKGAQFFDSGKPFKCTNCFEVYQVLSDHAAIVAEQEILSAGTAIPTGMRALLYDENEHFYNDQIIKVKAVNEIGRYRYSGKVLPILQTAK